MNYGAKHKKKLAARVDARRKENKQCCTSLWLLEVLQSMITNPELKPVADVRNSSFSTERKVYSQTVVKLCYYSRG